MHDRFGHIAAIDQYPVRNFPDVGYIGKDALLVGEDHGYATGSFADLLAYTLFSLAVKRRKRLIEQQEIIITGKNTGEMQALELPPLAQGPAFLSKHRYLLTG